MNPPETNLNRRPGSRGHDAPSVERFLFSDRPELAEFLRAESVTAEAGEAFSLEEISLHTATETRE